MALVGPGTDLYLAGLGQPANQSIQYELEEATDGIGLLEAIALSGEAFNSMRDFEGYSAGSDIVVDFHNTITWDIDLDYEKDANREITMTGRVSGDVISININSDFIEDDGGVILDIDYNVNGGSYQNLLQRSATSNDDVSITGVDYNDVIRLKVNIFTQGPNSSGDVAITITGGTFTSGSGTITASGATEWDLFVFEV